MKKIIIFGNTGAIGNALCSLLYKKYYIIGISKREIFKSKFIKEYFSCDITNFNKLKRIKNIIKTKHNKIYSLINCAGITIDKYILNKTSNEFKEVIETNLSGCFNIARIFYSILNKNGCIINIGSRSGVRGAVGQTDYSASKSGLIGFTKTLAKELAKKKIRVNLIIPPFTKSKMTLSIDSKIRKKLISGALFNHYSAPKETGFIIKFLLSDEAKYISGQVISCDNRI